MRQRLTKVQKEIVNHTIDQKDRERLLLDEIWHLSQVALDGEFNSIFDKLFQVWKEETYKNLSDSELTRISKSHLVKA